MYDFSCPKSHVTEEFMPFRRLRRSIKCPDCGDRAFRLIAAAQHRGGLQMKDKSVAEFRYAFDRKTRRDLKTAGDVDRAFGAFHARYPHLAGVSRQKDDPEPSVKIKDEAGCHD